MGKQRPIDLSGFDEIVKTNKPKELDLSGFDEIVKKKDDFQRGYQFGSKPLSDGSKPFLPQVPTKTPSVLLSDDQKQQREQERIAKRFETTLLNVPTDFGKVDQFMRSAKKVQDTLPQTPTIKPSTGGMVIIPQGEKIGDSLRKGDTLQDEFTDKLTGKKTGLQKQIENAENAFRAYQGDDIASQVPNYIPEEDTLKIKQELGFGEKMSNAGSNFVNRLQRFPYNTSLALGQTLTTLLGEDYGSDAYRMITASGNAEMHRMEAFDKLAKLDAEYKYGKGLIDSIQDFDIPSLAAAVTDAVGSLVSTVVTSAPTAGLGLYSDMVGSGLYDYNSTKANRLGMTVEQLYDSGKNEFFVPAILGGIGARLEKIGLNGIKQGIMSNIKGNSGQRIGMIFHNVNREGVTEWTQTGVESYSNALAEGKNPIQAGEIAVKDMFSKKGAESYLMGVVASGAAIGGGRILKGMITPKAKAKASQAIQAIEQQQEELANPDLTNESRNFIIENIENNVNLLVGAVDSDIDTVEGLSTEQKQEINNLNAKIQALEIVANDPAVSEETKASAQTRIDELKSKVDGIIATPEIKLAKPPIDPPATDGAGVEARIQEIESLLSSDNASMQETGSGNLIKFAREELVLELAELKKKFPATAVVKPQSKEDAKKADYTKRIEKKIANASEEKNPIKKALILYEALNSATRVDTGQKENVQELLNAHLAESGLKIENVEIGTKYNETNTSLDATIAGEGIENLKVVEVLSPIIRDANGVIVKRGKVIVESSDNKKTPQLAKPTIDTEAQIIAEGQQAEADFQATDDLVTYEQKMKELDDRAKNLVPAPEEVEIEKPQREKLSHKIVKSNDNTTLDDMTKGGDLVPSDFYDKPQFYADINDKSSKESLAVINKAKGNPDAEVTIYRSVPQGVENIEEGDWVSLSSNYAKEHGMHPTDKTQDMPVISIKVKAKDIVWDGNDVNEFAYFPFSEQQSKPKTDAIQVEAASKAPQPTQETPKAEEQTPAPQPKPKVVTEEGKEEVSTTVLDKIPRGNTFQERLAPDYYEKLKKDIKENGIKEPIILTYYPKDNALRLSDGHHRLAIAKELGITDIPTKVNVAWNKSIKDNNPDIEGQPIYNAPKTLDIESYRKRDYFPSNVRLDEIGLATKPKAPQEQTPAQQVEQLRAEEQAELKAAIPNAGQYLTDGKVDRAKITDAKDLKKFDKIYDEYDKLITPLLPKKETKAGSVGGEVDFTAKGGNKVVDEKGQPLVLYHGTSKGLQAEDLKQSGQAGDYGEGIYFATDKREAEQRNAENIIEANVKSDKHLVIGSKEYFDGIYKTLEKKYGSVIPQYAIGAEAKKAGYTSIEVERPEGKWIIAFDGAKIQSLKETKAEQAPAKPKATKLKAKVDTRLKFQEVSDLSTKINEAVKGSAKRKRLIGDRNLLLEKFPIIKYVYDNIQNITKQLIQKGIITKGKDKVTYNGVNYSSDEFSSLLHDGLLDQLVNDNVIDDSNFSKKPEMVEKTEFDSEEEAELYAILRETDPNVIAAKYFTLPTLEEGNYKEFKIGQAFAGKKPQTITAKEWAEYGGDKEIPAEIKRRYINNKKGDIDDFSETISRNIGVTVTPEDIVGFLVEYGSQSEFNRKKVSNVQQALLERYFELTNRKQITDAAAKKGFDAVKQKEKADRERKLTPKEQLEEVGVTEEDIAKYEEFSKEGFGELETPLEKREFARNEKIRALKKEAENAENDLLSFVSKSRGQLGVGANVAEFAAKLTKVLKTYAELGIVTLEGVIDRLIAKAGEKFVDENIDAIKEVFNKFNAQKENIKEKAKELLAAHKELVKKAKEAIDNNIKNVDDFAEYIKENKTSEIEDAWREANDRGKKTSSDFKAEAEKLQAKEEKERLRQEDLGIVTPKLEDYASEEPIKVSSDFESLAYQEIESKEFRNTLSNKERESGRQLTRAEKRYEVNPLMSAFELGENIVAKAKEEFGDTYVNDLLAYIAKNQNTLGVDKASLIMLTLENDLNRQLQEDPDNLTLKKQENMVQNLAIAYLRSAARSIGYGRLRQIARVGYDVDEVTSQLFSSEQEEGRRKVVKAMESTADEINNEAELKEQESESELVIEEPKVKRDAKQVRADIREVIKQMKADLVKSARGARGALAAIPFAQQVKDVTPHIIKLSKLFAELGGMKTKDIVAEIRKSIKGLAPDVDENTITDILKEGKRILTEEQKRKNYIKSLEKDINDLDTQIEEKKRKVVSKEDKYKNDEEIQNLRDIKNGKKDLLNTLDPSYAERVKLKNDLNAAQRSLEEYERKIAENDFETAKKPIQQDIDSKLKELRDKRDSARNEYQDKKKAFEASLITPESIEEKNIDRAIKATEKSIAELERKLAEGDVTVTPKGQSPYSKQLGELKQKQSQLRDKLIEERNKAIGKSAPKDRLEQAKDRVNKRIEQLKEEIADKRKELKAVGKVKSDLELDSLREQEKELKKIANQYLTQESIDRINESKEKSIVTKIENEIAKLDEQIANQQKIQKEKKAPLTTLEITLLKAQRKAKIEMLNELDPDPKAFTKQALIDAGYGREITVTTKQGKEKRQVLDWKKLAGKEMDVTAIKNIVEQALKDKGFTPAQISRMQDAFVNEFTELRASVVEKSIKELRKLNEPKESTKRKSSAKRLAELFDLGLFDQKSDEFDYLINKAIGLSDIGQEAFFEAKKLSESLKELFAMNSNEFFTKQFIREINLKISKLLNKVAFQEGNNWFRVTNVVSELMNLGLRTKLQNLKQFFDNQISGRQERLIQDIGTMFQKGIDTKELKKLRSKYASLIKDDIKKNAGLYFGEVNSPFLTKSQIEDYINSRTDNQMYHLLVSIALGKSYLEGADSLNKAASTEKFFISMLLKVMTDKTNPNRMTPEDALKFVNEQLTGQKFEDALKESAKIINQINTQAGKVVLAETKQNIFRGAMDLVKANLLVGQALDANTIESAYNAAYKIAGYGLGHESNNLVTTLVNGFQSRIEEQIKKAVKEKQWGKAANLTIIATINRNILNPFVGGGTNWLVLGLQKSGIEPISPLYYMMEKIRNGIDLSTDSGVKKLEETLVDDYRRKTINKRLLIGGVSASLFTLALFASGGDDEMEEWLKKNEWARPYQTVFVPQLTLFAMSVKNGTLGDWVENTFARYKKFENLPKIIRGVNAYNKSDGGEADKAKLYGVIGNVVGSFVNVPLLPVSFVRNLGGVYKGIMDKPQEKPDFKNVGLANGFFNYGLIDYMGFRPDRTYMRDMEEYIPKSDEKTIRFLRKNDLDINSNSDKAVLSNGIKKSLTEDEAQKYDNVWGAEAYRVIKEALADNEDLDETQIKSLKKVAEFTATRKAQSELGVDDSSLQQLEIDGVKYSLTESQINKRKALMKEYIREKRGSEEFKSRYREAVKKGNIVGSAESKYFMLMESAKASATRKMNDIYEKKTSSLQVAPN